MRISSQLVLLFLSLAFSGLAQTNSSQTQQDVFHPKVGLVLSGGGAKGMAHVGVLKVLEQIGIVPDFITGTSMGAVIGGLYALGYDADTLAEMINSQNWEDVLSDKIPLERVLYEEKPFFENQLAEFDFEKFQVKVPSGIIEGQQVQKLLSRYTLPAISFSSFDEFPIPFMCNGSDMISGNSIAITSGDLAEAMRISMAIPTIFTPVQRDKQLLVDGGLVHNFAVQDVIDMGADIVIGVYTGRLQADIEQLQDVSEVLLQSIFLMGVEDAERQQALCDIYIEPDLSQYSAAHFHLATEIMRQGELAARMQKDELQKLADSLAQFDKETMPPTLVGMKMVRLSNIVLHGNLLNSTRSILGKLGLPIGKTIPLPEIENGIDRLFGTNMFDKITYQIKFDDGTYDLHVFIEEKPESILKAAINYDSYHNAGFLFGLIKRNLFMENSRFTLVSKLAANFRFRASYLKYLTDNQQIALGGSISLNRDDIPIINNRFTVRAFKLTESIYDAFAQYRIVPNMVLQSGISYELLQFKPSTGEDPGFTSLSTKALNLYTAIAMNTYDRNVFPTRGLNLSTQLQLTGKNKFDLKQTSEHSPMDPTEMFNQNGYWKFTLESDYYLPIHPRTSVYCTMKAGYISSLKNTIADFYLLGAPIDLGRRNIPFLGLQANEAIANKFILGGVGLQYFIKRQLMLRLDGNFTNYQSLTSLGDQEVSSKNLYGVGLTLGYNSFLGPIQFSVSTPLTNNTQWNQFSAFLSVGHRF